MEDEHLRGQNSIVKIWEQKLGIPKTDPNFESQVLDALSSESDAVASSTLYMLGLREAPPVKHIKLDKDAIPDWILREK